MTKDEALKLAIQLRDTASGYWTEQEIPIIDKLIELLAQHDSVQAKPEPEQCKYPDCKCPTKNPCLKGLAQRTWVGLTNDELTDLFYNTNLGQQSAVAQAIALLKERNT